MFVCQDRGRSYLDTPSHSLLGVPTDSPLPRQQAPINRVLDLKKHKVTQLVLDMVGLLACLPSRCGNPRHFFRAANDRPFTDERVKLVQRGNLFCSSISYIIISQSVLLIIGCHCVFGTFFPESRESRLLLYCSVLMTPLLHYDIRLIELYHIGGTTINNYY